LAWTYCDWIFSSFFSTSWMVWSVPMFVADLTLPSWIWAMTSEVSFGLYPPAVVSSWAPTSTASTTTATQKMGPRK
jgi:hypothetical protein